MREIADLLAETLVGRGDDSSGVEDVSEQKKWAPPPAVRRTPGQSPGDQKERLTNNWLIPFFLRLPSAGSSGW
jgi:hypothetical protein